MPSTPAERLQAIQNNYNDALNNEPNDMAAAQTAADVSAVQANVHNASNAYFTAVTAAFTNDGSAVEAAYSAAMDALKSVKDARTAAEEIPKLIGKLTSSTNAATNLLNAAKKLA